MQKFLSLLFILSITLAGCSSDDGGTTTTDDGGGVEPITATYRITFTPNFTADAFPTDYPTNPTFAAMIVAVHEPGKTIFNKGQLASDGIKLLAEDGDGSDLVTFLNSQGGEDEQDFLVTQAVAGGGATQSQSVNVTVTPEKTEISFVTSLSPSPDWFIGVNGFSIVLDANTLVSDESISLNVLDAGTDSGTTYTSPNNPTSPPATITVVNTPPIATTGGISPSIGTLRVVRTDL
ncbi:MAG: spondin domain-containing protein [Gilvibacter sp.]